MVDMRIRLRPLVPDEAGLHERMVLGRLVIDHPGALKYLGLLPGTILLLVVGVSCVSLLHGLAPRTRGLFILAGGLSCRHERRGSDEFRQ